MTIASCPPGVPPVHGVVVFNAADWKAAYPEFAGISDVKAQASFDSATLVMANTCRSIVQNAPKRERLLYLLTAHVCALRFGSNDGEGTIVPPTGVVGRLASATEGTVTAAIEYASTVPQAMAYFIQTQWGAMFWQATASLRTMRYVAPPQTCCGQCGGLIGQCGCAFGSGLGPVGTGSPGYNGGTS